MQNAALTVARACLRNEILGPIIERSSCRDAKFLTPLCVPRRHRVDATCARRSQQQPRTGLHCNPHVHSISGQQARRGAGHIHHEPAFVVVRFAEMHGRRKRLPSQDGDTAIIQPGHNIQTAVQTIHTKSTSRRSHASSSSFPFPLRRSAKINGRSPRWVLASRAITLRSAPTCGASSILLMSSKSLWRIAGPPLRGILSPGRHQSRR